MTRQSAKKRKTTTWPEGRKVTVEFDGGNVMIAWPAGEMPAKVTAKQIAERLAARLLAAYQR